MNERRLGARHPHELLVDLHTRRERVRLTALDVSRHGMFVATDDPPPLHHAVLLTVRLRGGPFDTMANVVRMSEQSGVRGVGLKLFCLGADAKDRWDRFVASLDNPGVELPTRAPTRAAACFLVQPDRAEGLLDFYLQNVAGAQTLYLSPAVRRVGADVNVVLVHPKTHEELLLRAHVVEWNPDHPMRMGVQFDVDKKDRELFRAFLAGEDDLEPIAPVTELERTPRASWTEYAFYSSKLRNAGDPTGEILLLDVEATDPGSPATPQELDVIEGKMLELRELDLVDRKALFDFDWEGVK